MRSPATAVMAAVRVSSETAPPGKVGVQAMERMFPDVLHMSVSGSDHTAAKDADPLDV
jgi:hypothetical protein